MKSTNISIVKLVDALNGKRSLKKPVGYAKNAHDQFMVAFIATDHDTGEPKYVGEGEDRRVRLNWRVSKRQEG